MALQAGEAVKRTVLVAVVLVGLLAAPTLAATEDEPRFEVFTPEPRLEPGASQTVTIELVNDAKDPEDTVPPATHVRVEPRAGKTPFEVLSGSRSLGRMTDGEIHTVDVRLAVPADAPGDTYRLPLELTYEYDGDEREKDTVRATVEVPRRPIFRVTAVESDLRVGESGSVNLTVANVGSRAARATALEVNLPNPGVTFGGTDAATGFVGNLSVGERRSVSVDATATADASARTYPLSVRPTYRDRNGIDTAAPSRTANVTVAPKQSLAVRDVSLDLYGTVGVLSATVENTGPAPTASTVATVESADATVNVLEGSASIGRLDVGDTADVTYALRVSRGASPGAHRFELGLRYDRGGAETYRTDPVSVVATVPADRRRFAVEVVNGTLQPDASNTIDVRLTNEGDVAVSDSRATMRVSPPYESARPTAFAGTLEPGESRKLTFELTTPEDAAPGTDSLVLNVTGETPDGRAFTDGPHTVAVTYPPEANSEQDVVILAVGAIVVLLVLGAGTWWLRH